MATVGRPPKYSSPEEMQAAIDEYFADHQPRLRTAFDGSLITGKNGMPMMELNPPTISGLALHLGFVNRASMYDYESKEEFTNTIKTARLRCEEFVESNGMSGIVPPAMAIFALKNYGWSDKQEIEHSGGTTDTVINVIGVKAKD